MQYITLNNGIRMPILGLGTARLLGEECERSILEALDVGYRLIDTAQMYDNERAVGNAIKQSNISRKELFITSKLHRPSNSYKRAKEGIEKSLNELQVDYIDLLLIHEPYLESLEMYEAMKEAYRDNKIRAIGISNFNSELYSEFIKSCKVIPAVNQVETHVFYQQNELQELMRKYGTHMEAWSPFTAGRKKIFDNETLKIISKKYEKSIAQIALKYLLQRNIVVIPRSSNRNRMIENINVFNFSLTEEDMKMINKLDQNKTLFGWY